MKSQIRIGPEFFSKAPNDYSDRFWAWAREIVQNSVDAPDGDRVTIDVRYMPTVGTVIDVTNNGEPMSEDILSGKLLSLGGSGKNCQNGSIGGFGKAKELLYFCHEQFSIHTGYLFCHGAGAEYELAATPFHLRGTHSTVIWMGGAGVDAASQLVKAFEKLIGRTQWHGDFVLNGQSLRGNLYKGCRRREFDWGTVYTTTVLTKEVVVRVGGMPMFTRQTSAPRGVIVELKGSSIDRLYSNRDGLRWPTSTDLDNFVTSLSVDTTSALRSTEPRYTLVEGGSKLRFRQKSDHEIDAMTVDEIYGDIADACEGNPALFAVASVIVETTRAADMRVDQPKHGTSEFDASYATETPAPRQRGRLAFDFLLKNLTAREIPPSFNPASPRFSKNSTRLVKWWAAALLKLHELTETSAEFTVGFIFDADREAEHDSGHYGQVYLINPCTVATGAWKARYTRAADKHEVLSLAIHEFVHGLGLGPHDEAYANKLTDVTTLVLKNLKHFRSCWR